MHFLNFVDTFRYVGTTVSNDLFDGDIYAGLAAEMSDYDDEEDMCGWERALHQRRKAAAAQQQQQQQMAQQQQQQQQWAVQQQQAAMLQQVAMAGALLPSNSTRAREDETAGYQPPKRARFDYNDASC